MRPMLNCVRGVSEPGSAMAKWDMPTWDGIERILTPAVQTVMAAHGHAELSLTCESCRVHRHGVASTLRCFALRVVMEPLLESLEGLSRQRTVDGSMIADQCHIAFALRLEGPDSEAGGGDQWVVSIERALSAEAGDAECADVFCTFSTAPLRQHPPSGSSKECRAAFQPQPIREDGFYGFRSEAMDRSLHLR